MTWGQLRLLLQQQFPGVSADMLDGSLNSRYEQVLRANDWTGVHYHWTLQTLAAYQSASDTAALTLGQADVTGAGTSWDASRIGQKFYRPGDTSIYTVTAVDSATSLTLERAYEGNGSDATGTVYAGASYVFMQNVYQLPADVRSVVSMLDPITNFPLTEFSKAQLDLSAGPRTLVNDPACWALYDDSDEGTPPVLHQVELFPPPLHARGLVVQYLHAASTFDGNNTGNAPLPWVSDSVLLYGARADIAMYLAASSEGAQASAYITQAKAYEAKYAQQLTDDLRLEHMQRRAKTPLRMADRFTRHRLNRASRGLSNNWGVGAGGPN